MFDLVYMYMCISLYGQTAMCMCVCVYVCARTCACARVCMCVRVLCCTLKPPKYAAQSQCCFCGKENLMKFVFHFSLHLVTILGSG